MMFKPLDFADSEHKALLNRINSGNAVLFLGSGFSIGAIGSLVDDKNNKIKIPDVQQLKKILSDKVLYMNETEGTLKEICEDCQYDNGACYAQVMREAFTVSEVADFHKLYAEFDWKNIFTTNVDNVIEYVYAEFGKTFCSVYTENPSYSERGSLNYYKLHGDARIAPEKITFSTTDYVTNVARRSDCRFEALTAALKTENMIFIGTSLNEEWDFDIKCQQADIYIVSNKTYFILNNYNEKIIKRIQRKFRNAIFIQETAESFICKVKDYLSSCPAEKQNCMYEKWNLKHIQRQNYNLENYLKPDLYLGAEPTWEDVFSNHDVIWKRTSDIIKNLKNGNINICTVIIGKPISGKTTMLYRLGVTLCDANTVLEYNGDDFIDDVVKFIEGCTNRDVSPIILLDDANWLLGRIARVIEILEGTSVRLIITVREKEYEKRQHLFDDELNSKIKIIKDINKFNTDDYKLYLDKLNDKSFLGHYSKGYTFSRSEAASKLEKSIRGKKEDPLLMLAYKMKYGNEFKRRISAISKVIVEHENYNLKRFLVMLYFLDVVGDTGMKLSLFLDLYPMSPDMLQQFVSEIKDLLISNINLKSWERSDYSKIIIHGRFSEIIKKAISDIDYLELEELVEDIFRRIDNVYHFKCRQSNTYQNYVLYTLLRSQNISELFRNNKNRKVEWKYINQLYENLHEYFGDYHLYWLHRGISEVKMRNYASAKIHLEQARVTRQSYSYEIEHSFAMLYFEQAIHSNNISEVESGELLNKALEIIRLQIGREENDAFSIHSFIIKTIQYYRKYKQEIPDSLMKEMLEYYYLARKRFKLSQSIIRRNMLMCIYGYLSDYDKIYDYNMSITQEELSYISRKKGENHINYNILSLL